MICKPFPFPISRFSFPKMKRHPALHPLSREHHQFLMWCRNVRWHIEGSPRAPDLETLLAEIRGQAPYIEAHFDLEETRLFPVCEAALGEVVLPYLVRLRADHAHWRAQLPDALAVAPTNIQLLDHLAQFLHDHLRYEERVFFPLLQEQLTEAAWENIAEQMG
jgi:iron-sulfur cluster repair protein YtfE (RIC family)